MLAWHRKVVEAMPARHSSNQKSATALLQQAREQSAHLQKELDSIRHPPGRNAGTERPQSAAIALAQAAMHRALDESPSKQSALPASGFADTIPSRQFAPSTSFGLLQHPGGA
jgi:hypothetical protein